MKFIVFWLIKSLDEIMKTQEDMKQKRITVKSQCDDIENEYNEIKNRLAAQQKEMASVNKQVTALETKLEQKKADRHSLLKQCKVTYSCWFIPSALLCMRSTDG